MKTLTIILTDGPYISEYAEMAGKIAKAALKHCRVNIFLYLDAVHIPKAGQSPAHFINAGQLFSDLAARGVRIEACPRCATARGYSQKDETSPDYFSSIKITSLYNLAGMLEESDRVICLSR
jgi:tRNA 2-thiouridine synthesizing protein D